MCSGAIAWNDRRAEVQHLQRSVGSAVDVVLVSRPDVLVLRPGQADELDGFALLSHDAGHHRTPEPTHPLAHLPLYVAT